jgi:hypothetical protein
VSQRVTQRSPGEDQNGAGPPRQHQERWFKRHATTVVLVSTGAIVLLSLTFIAAAHIDDRYGLDHASGARVALARYFDRGVLYPELYDGEFYGGTRFMPLPLIAHGSVAKLTGEYLESGKIMAYAFALLLSAVLIWLLRRMGSPWPLCIGLVAAVFATRVGLNAVIDLRGDLPALILQLIAVGLVTNSRRSSMSALAGVLGALAFLAKTSAIWAPIAIGLWLLWRDRRRFLTFALVYVGSVGVLLALFGLLTNGRMFENVFGLAGSGISSPRSLLVAPYRLVMLMISHAAPVLPLSLVIAWVAWRRVTRGEVSLYLLSFATSLIIVWLVLTDIGTGWNQLIDPLVLGALLLGEAAGGRARRTGSTVAGVVVLGLITANLLGLALTYRVPVRDTLTGAASWTPRPLEGVAGPNTRLLAEDPYLPVSLGQTPVVLDPYMALRIGRDRPRDIDDLAARIRNREFDLIALVEPLEPLDREWWTDVHFGTTVMRAVSESYDFDFKLQGYYLYRPREVAE